VRLAPGVSIRESGCVPVDVFDFTQNVSLGSGVTSWVADFAVNEQKIFQLIPTPPCPFGITNATPSGDGLLCIQWQSPGPNYRYTLEESVGLPPSWQAATGTNVWPILQTEVRVPLNGAGNFFRVKAEPF